MCLIREGYVFGSARHILVFFKPKYYHTSKVYTQFSSYDAGQRRQGFGSRTCGGQKCVKVEVCVCVLLLLGGAFCFVEKDLPSSHTESERGGILVLK